MTNNLHDRISAILGPSGGYDAGYAAGVEDTLAALAEFVAARGASTPEAAVAGASASADQPRRRRRRNLTPTEARVLDFVAANPGCTMQDFRDANVVQSPGTVYSLVARRKLRRTEDPKPHLDKRPWVHFYPMEPRNNG